MLYYFNGCLANNGKCYEDNPRNCVCPKGKGPASSLLPSLPELYQFREYQCPCPANTKTFGTFEIDGKLFFEQTVYTVPCSGIQHGVCQINNGTHSGECLCRTHNLNDVTEDAYIGIDCGVPVAIEPFKGDVKNGPINKEKICNGHGVSCPHGQSEANPEGNIEDARCFNQEDGCVCDNGWGGPSCTSPEPYDYAYGKFLTLLEEEYGTIDLLAREEINYLNVTGSTTSECLVSKVTISNNQQDVVECIYNAVIELYECDRGDILYQYVNVFPADELDIDSIYGCTVNALKDNYALCGADGTVNPFAGRFLENANFRNKDFYLYSQQFNVSQYGAYNGECMCGPNNDGSECKAGVSAIREESKNVCGEEILPSRGTLGDDGLCDCNAISSVDVTGLIGPTQELYSGEACEIIEAYNVDLDDVVPCAGHGSPQAIDIPYGQCGIDLDKYESDSLSEPFSVAFGDPETFIGVHTLTADSFFTSYRKDDGTSAPTSSPTNSPTMIRQVRISRSFSDQLGNLESVGGGADENCDSGSSGSVAFITFSGSSMVNKMSVLDQTLPVYGDNDILLANSPDELFSTNLLATLETAVDGLSSDPIWTGNKDSGSVNCFDWTNSNSFSGTSGVTGSTTSLTSTWYNVGTERCGSALSAAPIYFLCYKVIDDAPTNTTNPLPDPRYKRMYGSAADEVVSISRLKNSVNLTYTPNDIPLKSITTNSLMRAILWSQYVYIENGVTKTIDYDCNPAEQVKPPGSTDTKLCPYIDLCLTHTTGFPTTFPTASPLGPTASPMGDIIPENTTFIAALNAISVDDAGDAFFFSLIFNTDMDPTLLQFHVIGNSSPGKPRDQVTLLSRFLEDDPFGDFWTAGTNNETCEGLIQFFNVSGNLDLWPAQYVFEEITFGISYDGVAVDLVLFGGITPVTAGTVTGTGSMFNGMTARSVSASFLQSGTDVIGLSGDIPLGTEITTAEYIVTDRVVDGENAGENLCGPIPVTLAPVTPAPTTRTNSLGCVSSYVPIPWPGIGSIQPGTYDDLSVREMFSVSNDNTFDVSFGNIRCNNFIDRTINCILIWVGFEDQCPDEPIGCFDNSIGFVFGGFNAQHPSIKYTVDRTEWTLDHYRGIGSILNDYKYLTREVLTPKLMVDYLRTWVSDDLETFTATITPIDTVYQTDLLQARNTVFPDLELSGLTVEEKECQFGILSSCRGLNYANNTNLLPLKPGLQMLFNYSGVIELTITPNHAVKYTGIEIVDQFNNVLAQDLNPANVSRSFPILTSGSSYFSVRYLGLESIYDGPEQYLEPPVVDDDSYDYVYANYLGDGGANTTFLLNERNTSFNLFAANAIDIDEVYAIPSGFKYKARKEIDDLLDNVVYTIEYVSDINILNTTDATNAWQNITNNIINDNRYPFNQPLADLNINDNDRVAIDYTSDDDLKYLYDVWTIWLAPRYCSTDTQCKTFELGECIRPTDTVNIGWLQGDPDIDESPVGIEGGCLCYNEFNLGFGELSNACQTCVDGYGPSNLQDFYDMEEYSALISQTYNSTDTRFSLSQSYVEFTEQLFCRLPWGFDPIVSSFKDENLCAGHGMVEILPEVEYNSTITDNTNIPLCNSLWINNISYALNDKYSDPRTLIYSNDTTLVTIIDNTVYVSGEIVVFNDCTQDNILSPLWCSVSIGEIDDIEFLCVNNDLYDEDGKDIAISYVSGDDILRIYKVDKFHYRFLSSQKVAP